MSLTQLNKTFRKAEKDLKKAITEDELLSKLFKEVKKEYSKPSVGKLGFHNLDHVLRTASRALRLCKKKDDKRVIIAACLLHDIALTESPYEEHEKKSALKAVKMLKRIGFSKEETERIRSCILATDHLHAKPEAREQAIVKDADLMEVADGSFLVKSMQLAKEFDYPADVIAFNTVKLFEKLLPEPFFTKKARKIALKHFKNNYKEMKKAVDFYKVEKVRL